MLQLFQETRKYFSHTKRGRLCADINILVCGDPRTCKSQLPQYMYNLLPWDQDTSEKCSSAVDLSIYVENDPKKRQLVLEIGVFVLNDSGICSIDKFEKRKVQD